MRDVKASNPMHSTTINQSPIKFSNVLGREVTGFHRSAKLFVHVLNFVTREPFLYMVKPGWTKSSSQTLCSALNETLEQQE